MGLISKLSQRTLHRRYEAAAAAGDADAMLFLGTVTAKKDPAASREWFRRAAEHGNLHIHHISLIKHSRFSGISKGDRRC